MRMPHTPIKPYSLHLITSPAVRTSSIDVLTGEQSQKRKMNEEATSADAALLRDLRFKLAERLDDDTPVATVVEQKQQRIGMLINKLNACTSSLPTPDKVIVKQIEIFAELQVCIKKPPARNAHIL